MSDINILITNQEKSSILISKIKVKEKTPIYEGKIILFYQIDFNSSIKKKTKQLKAKEAGNIYKILVKEGDIVEKNGGLYTYKSGCSHSTIMNDLCAECGLDLQKDDKSKTQASVPMVHTIPMLKVSEEQAQLLGKADEVRLIEDRKLVLLVDLDQTLIHTTNDNIPPNIKDVYHFQLNGSKSIWYHTRLRPGTLSFLQSISNYFELHICTFGSRNYAHQIAHFLDKDGKYFSHRILSRDECFHNQTKTANLKALFPCGDNMVCIIDDREDVWNYAQNLIHVKPYHFFRHTGDINAPPGLSKCDMDDKEGYTYAQLAQGVCIKRKKDPEKEKSKKMKISHEKGETIKTEENNIVQNKQGENSNSNQIVYDDIKVLEEKISNKHREIVSIVKIVRTKSTEKTIELVDLDDNISSNQCIDKSQINLLEEPYVPESKNKNLNITEYIPSPVNKNSNNQLNDEYIPIKTNKINDTNKINEKINEPYIPMNLKNKTDEIIEYIPTKTKSNTNEINNEDIYVPINVYKTNEINTEHMYIPTKTKSNVNEIDEEEIYVPTKTKSNANEIDEEKIYNPTKIKSNANEINEEVIYIPTKTKSNANEIDEEEIYNPTKIKSNANEIKEEEIYIPTKTKSIANEIDEEEMYNPTEIESNANEIDEEIYIPTKTKSNANKIDEEIYIPTKTKSNANKIDEEIYIPTKTKSNANKIDEEIYIPTNTKSNANEIDEELYIPSKTLSNANKIDENMYIPTNTSNNTDDNDNDNFYLPTKLNKKDNNEIIEEEEYIPSKVLKKDNNEKDKIIVNEEEYIPSKIIKKDNNKLKNKNDNNNDDDDDNEMKYIPSKNINNKYNNETNKNDNNENDSDDIIEVEEVDDYLLYLEEILKHIHKKFYEIYDKNINKITNDKNNIEYKNNNDLIKINAQNINKFISDIDDRKIDTHKSDSSKTDNHTIEFNKSILFYNYNNQKILPDLKHIIPEIKSCVLKNLNLVFSGVVPSKMKLTDNKVYSVAKTLGANVDESINEYTTHLVAVRTGTAKVNEARKKKNIYIVTLDWLWMCAERWERVDERLFPISNKTTSSRTPPAHCASPEHKPSHTPPHISSQYEIEEENDKFSNTINPLMTLSSEEIKNMDKEVEDVFDDDDDDDDDAENEEDKDNDDDDAENEENKDNDDDAENEENKDDDDAENEENKDDDDAENEEDKDKKINILKRKRNDNDDESSSSSIESLSGDRKGWSSPQEIVSKNKRKKHKKYQTTKENQNSSCTLKNNTDSSNTDSSNSDNIDNDGIDEDDDETINSKFRRCAKMPSDFEIESSEGSNEESDTMEDIEWNMMGAALEREFTGN